MKKLLFGLLLCSATSASAQSEYAIILDRIRTDMLPDAAGAARQDKTIASTMMSQQADGSWADVNYGKDTRDFEAGTHLNRIRTFAQAYVNPASTFHQQATVMNAITKGLQYWNEKDPQSWNWYHNQIFSPQHLGEILILLEKTNIDASLRNRLLKQMERGDPRKWTGANKLDIAAHYIYRACLTANDTLMRLGVDEAFYPIFLTKEEGIQHDYGYQQHGPQLYIYGYGSVFVDGETRIAYYLRGTSYALAGDKLNIFSNFVRNTYLKAARGSAIDWGTMGRSISRPNAMRTGGSANLVKLKALDPAHAAEYDAAIARNMGKEPASFGIKPMHTQFWKADYTLHHRAAYCFGVHTTSTRTAKQENGNDENLKGYYLSDGSTFISSKGGEYLNISPVWDWSMIPGVTAPYLKELPIRKSWGFNFGSTAFSGGVSDSLYGAAALDFNDYNTRIHKAWFFFDDEVVCLGAGLTSTAGEDIYTTVNQCLQQGRVRTNDGKKLQWLTHDGISYYFPTGEPRYSTEKQTGDWYSINKNGTKELQQKEVFKLWLDHGKQPADKDYAYYVIPGKNMDQYDTKAVRILQNSADIQAVQHTKLNILQVVFYKAGTFKNGNIHITVDRGCVLMVRDGVLSIADPAQLETPVQVELQMKDVNKKINCALPKGAYAGGTVRYGIE